jgi:hypothetical protein
MGEPDREPTVLTGEPEMEARRRRAGGFFRPRRRDKARGWLGLAGALLVGLLVLPVGPRAADPARIVVEDWSRHRPGQRGIPEGWKGQNWGSPAYDFVIATDGAATVIQLKSEGDGSTISKEVKIDVTQFPIIEWRWKVVTLPRGGDSRRKETDDQAAQVYVTFPRFPSAVRSRIISYVWDTTAPAGTVVPSAKNPLVTYVVIRSGAGEAGTWFTETRNVRDDYRRIYGEEPGEQVGWVSIAVDSNDVKDRAESYFGAILFRKP